MAVSVNSGVIEVSDSESSTDSSGTAEHVAADNWVRRSSRTRKTVVRFSPDDADEPAPSRRGSAGKAVAPKVNRSDTTSFAPQKMEIVDPDDLIHHVVKLRKKISVGEYGIEMPIGPEEHVLVDGVDYMKSLGYNDIEKEENTFENELNSFLDNGVPESRISKFDEVKTGKLELSNMTEPETNFWDTSTQLSSNGDSDAPSSELSVDVESSETPPAVIVNNLRNNKIATNSKPSWMKIPQPRNIMHNQSEQLRRSEMSQRFNTLAEMISPQQEELGRNLRLPKVQVLRLATATIKQLQNDRIQLINQHTSLRETNAKRMQYLDDLKKQIMK